MQVKLSIILQNRLFKDNILYYIQYIMKNVLFFTIYKDIKRQECIDIIKIYNECIKNKNDCSELQKIFEFCKKIM